MANVVSNSQSIRTFLFALIVCLDTQACSRRTPAAGGDQTRIAPTPSTVGKQAPLPPGYDNVDWNRASFALHLLRDDLDVAEHFGLDPATYDCAGVEVAYTFDSQPRYSPTADTEEALEPCIAALSPPQDLALAIVGPEVPPYWHWCAVFMEAKSALDQTDLVGGKFVPGASDKSSKAILRLNPAGAAKLTDLTGLAGTRSIAVVVDGKVVTTLRVVEPVRSAQIALWLDVNVYRRMLGLSKAPSVPPRSLL